MFENLLNNEVTLLQLCKLDLSSLLLFTLGTLPLMSTMQHTSLKMVAITPFHQLKAELIFNPHQLKAEWTITIHQLMTFLLTY